VRRVSHDQLRWRRCASASIFILHVYSPSISGSLLRVTSPLADQDDVGFPVAADEGELLTVMGVVEIADKLRFEVGELLSPRAVKMLQPEIVGCAIAHRVDNACPIARELDWPTANADGELCARPLEFHKSGRLDPATYLLKVN
jgi:hypothetical protein